ncbi:MAG: hypothetical protein HKO65_15200 [Gemmatimonadetes bacterium]|nr:hypothetical protein [Gemmatimonadota bacterium]
MDNSGTYFFSPYSDAGSTWDYSFMWWIGKLGGWTDVNAMVRTIPNAEVF